jgi:hypothetical protein
MDRTNDRIPQRSDEASTPGAEDQPTVASTPAEGTGSEKAAGDSTDRPDMRDPTNGSPYLTGQSTTSGLGGTGKETAGGGTGPRLDGGTVPPTVRDRHFPEKRHPSERRRAAIEDSVDGMEVYASSFGEVFSLPLPIAQGT